MLNPQQQLAVTTANKSALILSGAGTGKTSVLVERLAHHLQEGVNAEAIMAVTFTNKAASEIKSRLESRLNEPLTGLWLGTFHSLCYRLLIMHLNAKFKVITQSQQITLIKRLLTAKDLDLDAKKVLNFINAKKDHGMRASDSDDVFEQVYFAYQTYCKENLIADFGELLLRTYEILSTSPKLLRHYQHKFDYVLVDEAQDTNYLQFEFLKLLTLERGNLYLVGDDAQSIYAFRGAVVENLYKYQQAYPSHELITLEQNYRSSKTILEAANNVIACNDNQMKKSLHTDNPVGDKITLYTAHNDQKEAEYIATEILRLQAQGHVLSEMAILYRTNSQSSLLSQTLLEAQIPFYLSQGQSFFDRKEIKQVLCYLQLALNCHDNGSVDYCINVPPRGIGLVTKNRIIAYAEQEGISYWQACEHLCESNQITGKALQGVNTFRQLINELHVQIHHLSLSQALQMLIANTGLMAWYQQSQEAQERLENLDELIQLASVFKADQALELDVFEQFLANACLSGYQEITHNGVQLMTLHASKGLEFNTVFLVGLEQGLFPSRSANLQEERRLMYVGITRARQRLYITHAKQRQLYGTTLYQKPSVFLAEIPSKLVKSMKDKPLVTLKMPKGMCVEGV
jgi:DNA helicase-2/ATP-dependent DNA helicase PcrA